MTAGGRKRILVIANETVGGRALIDAVKKHADEGQVSVTVICPQNEPKHGYVMYDDSTRSAAENRLKTTLAQLKEVGIEAKGRIMDPDPYAATMDALSEFGADEIIISTHPETRSGWMRRDLIERLRDETGLPVEHVVVDLDAEREELTHTLVVANETVGGEPLFELLKSKEAEGPHRFTVLCPQGGEGDDAAHERLAHTIERLESQGLHVVGQVTHPDPFTSIQNALQFYAVDEIVISTFPETRSGWMRGDLIERVRRTTSKPVEHVVVDADQAGEGART